MNGLSRLFLPAIELGRACRSDRGAFEVGSLVAFRRATKQMVSWFVELLAPELAVAAVSARAG